MSDATVLASTSLFENLDEASLASVAASGPTP